jgi:hypothetical protein
MLQTLIMIELHYVKTTGGTTMTEPTKEELLARIAELEKKAAGPKRSGALEFRVGEKGGVSVYGLGRFPVTLYYEQWNRLLAVADDLRAFLEENKSRLKLKQPTE